MVKKLYIIAFLVFVIDRVFKAIFSEYSFSIFSYDLNTGAAFGILKNWNFFLILFGLFVIFLILYYRNDKKLEIGMGFLLGGVVSNVFDRILYDGVVDYIHLFNSIFNLADVSYIIGGVILAYYFWNK